MNDDDSALALLRGGNAEDDNALALELLGSSSPSSPPGFAEAPEDTIARLQQLARRSRGEPSPEERQAKTEAYNNSRPWYKQVADSAASLVVPAVNTATFGAYNQVTDALGLDSPENRERQEALHPFVTKMGNAWGYLAPGGGPGVLAKGITRSGEHTLAKLAANSPGLAKALGIAASSAPGRLATSMASGAAGGAATNAMTTGIEEWSPDIDPAEYWKKVGQAAEGGAAWGMGLGLVGGTGREVRRAIEQSSGNAGQDIRALNAYGVSTGPVPTRGFKDPNGALPENVKANPATRGEAARRFKDKFDAEVELQKSENANQFNEERGKAIAEEGDRLVNTQPAVDELTRQAGRKDLPMSRVSGDIDANGERVSVNDKLLKEGAVLSSRTERPMSDGKVYGSRSDQTAPRSIQDVKSLDAIRDKFDTLSKLDAEAGIAKDKTPYLFVANKIRHEMLPEAAPKLSAANRRYSNRLDKIGETEALGRPAEEIAQYGADNVTAGTNKADIERLRANLPERISPYELDYPRLLLAKERLSYRVPGGGASSQGMARAVWNAQEPLLGRVIYPAARAAGNMPVAQDSLLRQLRKPRDEENKR